LNASHVVVNVDRSRLPTQIEEDGHWWFASRTRALNVVLQQAIGPRRDLLIADVGCGAGNMYHHLCRYGDVIGIENHPNPVRVGRSRGYDIRQADGRHLPFPPEMFDLVTALDVIEHNEDDVGMLVEMERVLKPGGHVLVSVPAFQWLWSPNDDLNAHVRRYTAGQVKTKLHEAGFTPLRATYTNCLIFPLAAAMIVVSKRRKPCDLKSHYFDGDAHQVDMPPIHPLVNTILTAVGQVEQQLLRRVSLPVGTGLIVIARK